VLTLDEVQGLSSGRLFLAAQGLLPLQNLLHTAPADHQHLNAVPHSIAHEALPAASSISAARSTFLRILLAPVSGIGSLRNVTPRGHLQPPRCLRQCSTISGA